VHIRLLNMAPRRDSTYTFSVSTAVSMKNILGVGGWVVGSADSFFVDCCTAIFGSFCILELSIRTQKHLRWPNTPGFFPKTYIILGAGDSHVLRMRR
jgi:hypothetical protein